MNEGRIKIAEAMGWFKGTGEHVTYGMGNERIAIMTFGWTSPDGEFFPDHLYEHAERFMPNPENDANADYAVLEWMRSHAKHDDFRLAVSLRIQTALQYHIGDYYRAALEVIKDD